MPPGATTPNLSESCAFATSEICVWHRLGMIFSGIALLLSAVAIAVIAELTARGKVPVNGGAGIRIRSVMASQKAWETGHRAARPWLHLAAVVLATTAIISMVAERATADIALLVGMLVALTAVIISGIRAHRAASEVVQA